MEIFTNFWAKALLMVLIAGSVTGLLVGIWMLFRPESFINANRFLSQWYSMRKATKPLMVPHHTERFFYRHHRPTGLLIVAGSVYVLYALVSQYDRQNQIAAFFGGVRPSPMADVLVPGLALALGTGAVFALAVGAFLLVRPSLLKGFEAWANQWVSARRSTRFLDVMHTGPDRALMRRPRLLAVLLILGSLYALFWLGTYIQAVN